MALIKCKECGNYISDKAKACPKCGAPNIPSPTETNEDAKFKTDEWGNTGHAINSETDPPKLEDNHYDPEQTPKSFHKKLYIHLIILLILIAGGIGYYFYAQHQANLEEVRLESEKIEKLHQDSIEAARIEAARLDSIRQDSIFRNFTSNDLRVFELHGKVKDVNYLSKKGEVDGIYVSPIGNIFKIDNFNFDENGDLLNKKASFNLRSPGNKYLLGWKYNNNGYPTDGIFGDDDDNLTQYLRWSSEGQLKKTYFSFGCQPSSFEYKYDNSGNLISGKYEAFANSGFTTSGVISVKIEETDKWGNWLKRTLSVKLKDEYEVPTYDTYFEPDPGYKLVSKGDGYAYQKKYTKTFSEQRTITYYDPN
ncbi:MAG: zinc ribbon domain-containing protein [Muribaculaceae bacterium]|nr:zinc ribbon domain-containing protein [Muribaculaceae bacterium]